MKIAIIGAGNVGGALGRRWHEAGHDVTFGVREPSSEKYKDLEGKMEGIEAAVRGAEIVVLATPWDAAEDAVRTCGDLSGKVLVDCTNPLRPNLAGLTHGHDDSGGEQVARWATGAKVVKAFNTVGFNIMENPRLEDRRAVLFVCGDEDGKAAVRLLSDALGFETVDAGPLERARILEPFALLWITAAYRMGLGRDFAFSLIRRDG
jgi:hypothetical protein